MSKGGREECDRDTQAVSPRQNIRCWYRSAKLSEESGVHLEIKLSQQPQDNG